MARPCFCKALGGKDKLVFLTSRVVDEQVLGDGLSMHQLWVLVCSCTVSNVVPYSAVRRKVLDALDTITGSAQRTQRAQLLDTDPLTVVLLRIPTSLMLRDFVRARGRNSAVLSRFQDAVEVLPCKLSTFQDAVMSMYFEARGVARWHFDVRHVPALRRSRRCLVENV